MLANIALITHSLYSRFWFDLLYISIMIRFVIYSM